MFCLNLFNEVKSTLSGRAFQAFKTRFSYKLLISGVLQFINPSTMITNCLLKVILH